MWTIPALKTRARAAFKANYWPCVAVALIALAVSGTGSHFNFSGGGGTLAGGGDSDVQAALLLAVMLTVFVVVGVGMLVAHILLFNPLLVGCRNFYLRNTASRAGFGALGVAFRSWKRIVWTMFLRDLYLFLWGVPSFLAGGGLVAWAIFRSGTLLQSSPYALVSFFLAGFVACMALATPVWIKTYSYRLVPYLLADDPTLSGRAAIARSCALMDGHKYHACLLDFSFFGWIVLSVLTLGILAVFYVSPYMQCTGAELYRALVPSVPPPLPEPRLPEESLDVPETDTRNQYPGGVP